jgi:hypothetical protein
MVHRWVHNRFISRCLFLHDCNLSVEQNLEVLSNDRIRLFLNQNLAEVPHILVNNVVFIVVFS